MDHKATQNAAPLSLQKVKKFPSRIYVVFYKIVRRQITSMVTRVENNYAAIEITAEFCDIFTCVTCKQKEIGNTFYFVTAPRSSSVRCLVMLFLCFKSYFIPVLKKLPV